MIVLSCSYWIVSAALLGLDNLSLSRLFMPVMLTVLFALLSLQYNKAICLQNTSSDVSI